MELDLQSIRIVRAIAEHGTISGAARALGYSQPAVSQHLRRAEQRLGVPLVVRAGRGVRLTEPGIVLARHSHAITSALDAARGELAELAGLRTGTVRLAAFPTASSTIVPRLLHALRADQPGLTVTYLEAEPPEALAMLRDGAIDLAITFAYPGDRADPHRESEGPLETVPLFTEPVVIALPDAHPLATGAGPVELAGLADDRWIAGCPLCRGHLLAACEAVGVEPDIELETDNAVAVLNLVASELGVALLPRLALATATPPAGAAIRATSPSSDRSIQVVAQPGSRRVPSIAAVLDAIEHLDGTDWGLAPTR
ncbi:LysR family transcriptional regulator [Protaetiibacter larvae]|uniref:LysR family transcriptional regulator n=1 Tax=Protaetiibacter larvae TaxID=2592654 RepID=A0A5C1Y9B7_9MICO|nr:LysR family transcriptional regulator [Protaetiibacter larvae]QEO10270.1 LysR family transcriptional regulator [Protaetiibacter larvae]